MTASVFASYPTRQAEQRAEGRHDQAAHLTLIPIGGLVSIPALHGLADLGLIGQSRDDIRSSGRCACHIVRCVDQSELDSRIQVYYASLFDESQRLSSRSAQGRLEFERVQELIGSRISAGSRVLDVGGATGVHAAALSFRGHDVVLVDPVESHVERARQHGTFTAEIGDARDLRFEDQSFDVVLLFGPLYHLAAGADRLRCLEEARRVARVGGWVFASAIPRFASHAMMTLGRPELEGQRYPPEMIALLERGDPPASTRFPGGHFHTGEELFEELSSAGLVEVEVCAIEGPNGLALESFSRVDDGVHQAALTLVRAVAGLPGIRDLTNHLMGIGRVR